MRKIYRRVSFVFLTISLFFVFLFLDYFLLTRTTSWEKFLTDNNQWYVFLAINLSLLNNLLISVALTFLLYLIEMKKRVGKSAAGNSTIGVFLSLVSVGCAVCGGFLLPIVGIAASLTAFPFQGLEIKALSIGLLLFSINELTLRTTGGASATRSYRGYIALFMGFGACGSSVCLSYSSFTLAV